MFVTIKNENLCLTIDSFGAQMYELTSKSGAQYLWNGDKAYWKDRAPILFPFIGRLTSNSYKLDGITFPMGIHGFASSCEFSVVTVSSDSVQFKLSSNEVTLKQYPIEFDFFVKYSITDWTVNIQFSVDNRSKRIMPFAVGGHPGFRVPMEEGMNFEDYAIRFSVPCTPDRVGFSEDVFVNGNDSRFPLESDAVLHLRHNLFDNDAIVLKNMARQVCLYSDKTPKAITVSFPDMPYLGLWHMPKTDASYICIEPWSSLPARQNIVEEFCCKSDMIMLPSGCHYDNHWSIAIKEE